MTNETDVYASAFAKKNDLADLEFDLDKLDIDKLKNVSGSLSTWKSKVDDKLNIGKLETTLVDLSTLSYVVKNELGKMAKYNAKIKDIEDKIPDITNLVTTTTALNDNTNQFRGEIPSITNLATNTALTVAEIKIPNTSNLDKKTDYNTKINEIEKNYYWSWS